jgi:hypothetical protein
MARGPDSILRSVTTTVLPAVAVHFSASDIEIPRVEGGEGEGEGGSGGRHQVETRGGIHRHFRRISWIGARSVTFRGCGGEVIAIRGQRRDDGVRSCGGGCGSASCGFGEKLYQRCRWGRFIHECGTREALLVAMMKAGRPGAVQFGIELPRALRFGLALVPARRHQGMDCLISMTSRRKKRKKNLLQKYLKSMMTPNLDAIWMHFLI